MMYVFFSPIHYIKSRRTYFKQKRTALHMLALSGVVRPSHIELRYATSITSLTTFRTQPTAINHPQTSPIPLQSDSRNVALNIKQARQWTRNFSSVLVQLAKQPVVLPWSNRCNSNSRLETPIKRLNQRICHDLPGQDEIELDAAGSMASDSVEDPTVGQEPASV